MNISDQQKVTQNPDIGPEAGDPRAVSIVAALMGFGFVVWAIVDIPSLISYFVKAPTQFPRYLFTTHISWVAMLFLMMGALFLFLKKPLGYIFGFAAMFYWFGIRAFVMIYFFIKYGDNTLLLLLDFIGFRLPFSAVSLGLVVINATMIVCLTKMNQTGFLYALNIERSQKRVALALGIGMVTYGIATWLLVGLVFDNPNFGYFDF